MKVQVIKGGNHTDDRGTLRFVNDFDLKNVRRFYTIQHPDTSVVRAWQGHEIETKWFFSLKGSVVVAWVEIDDFDNPSDKLKAEYKILKAEEPTVVYLPPGYANGLKALEPNSEIAVFSDLDVKESVKEKRRYPAEWWFDWGEFEE
ncbi:MAG: dTDP-6-deoxy-3,4-keto-hexulose isomerase [Bacteroidales bacterium]|nr:dTDP-6-deoxy-3,4-keto-hexulose isomerase [Bacteroidales bacterium]